MGLGDVATDGQAQASATIVAAARLVKPGEPVEDPNTVLERHTGAVVGDLHDRPLAVAAQRQ